MTLFLDMDEVITDFSNAAARIHNQPEFVVDHTLPYSNDPEVEWDICARIGLSPAEFWAPVVAAGESFWSSLDPLPWAFDLWAALNLLMKGDVLILTSPARNPGASAGKVAWFQKHFSIDFRKFVLCPSEHKHQLASPGDILIDDCPSNVQEFHEAGGNAILFPMPWNAAAPIFAEDKCQHIIDRLKARAFDSVPKCTCRGFYRPPTCPVHGAPHHRKGAR